MFKEESQVSIEKAISQRYAFRFHERIKCLQYLASSVWMFKEESQVSIEKAISQRYAFRFHERIKCLQYILISRP
jgi:uncharacterized membrane protein